MSSRKTDGPSIASDADQSWLPEQDIRARWQPTREQHERLRYWDMFTYWVGFAVLVQQGQRPADPGFTPERR